MLYERLVAHCCAIFLGHLGIGYRQIQISKRDHLVGQSTKRLVTFEAFDQRDETCPDQQKAKDKEKDKKDIDKEKDKKRQRQRQ